MSVLQHSGEDQRGERGSRVIRVLAANVIGLKVPHIGIIGLLNCFDSICLGHGGYACKLQTENTTLRRTCVKTCL